jgi:hypothetical protein
MIFQNNRVGVRGNTLEHGGIEYQVYGNIARAIVVEKSLRLSVRLHRRALGYHDETTSASAITVPARRVTGYTRYTCGACRREGLSGLWNFLARFDLIAPLGAPLLLAHNAAVFSR